MKYDTSSLKWWQRISFWFTKDQWEIIAIKQCNILRNAKKVVRDSAYPGIYKQYPKYLQLIMKQKHEVHFDI